MSTIVLIHGGSHGAWCWYKLASLLRDKGHTVIAPDLPGHGIDKTPVAELSLQAYADCVCHILDAQSAPVILVGHSLGGLVITQAAEYRPEKIRTLVYLTALLPSEGVLPDMAVHNSGSVLFANLNISADQSLTIVRDEALKESFYEDCPQEDITLAKMLLLPEATALVATPVKTSNANYGKVPRIYIECLRDKALTPSFQKLMYERTPCQQVISMDTSHSPFFSAPDKLAAHLAAL